MSAVRDAPPDPTWPDADMLTAAWGLIANASGGDWTKESPDWQQAAAKWRDAYGRAAAVPACAHHWLPPIPGGEPTEVCERCGLERAAAPAPHEPTIAQLGDLCQAINPAYDGLDREEREACRTRALAVLRQWDTAGVRSSAPL